MRINMSLDSYDIKALDEIYSTADELFNKSEILEMIGILMHQKLIAAADEFETKNYERAKEAIENYINKIKIMRDELTELSKSCRDFAEKIAEIWS